MRGGLDEYERGIPHCIRLVSFLTPIHWPREERMARLFSNLADNALQEEISGRSSTIERDRDSSDVLSARLPML